MRLRCLPLIFFIFCFCFLATKARAQITAGTVSGTVSACVGTASFSPNLQQFTVTGNGLLPSITATAPSNFEISLSPGSGYVPNLTFPSTGVTLYVRAAAGAPLGGISGNVVLTASGAATQNVAVTGTVNALPTVNTVGNQTVTAGSPTTAVNFTGTGQVYNWTNNTPGIGLATSGNGDIPSFTPINSGSTTITATITVTPKPAGFIYTANNTDNSVSVINAGSNTIVATIPVGTAPTATFVSPDQNKVYVLCTGEIDVLNALDNTLITRISIVGTANGILSSPDKSKLYVIAFNGPNPGSFMAIDAVTNTITNNLSIGPSTMYVTLSNDGLHAYVATYGISGGGPTYVINTSTFQIEKTFSVIAYPAAILLSPDGSILYLSDRSLNKIIAINLSTNAVVNIPVGNYPNQPIISPDGSTMYVDNMLSNDVSVISLATNSVIATIPTGSYNKGVTLTPDGKFLYVTNRASKTVTVINTANKTVVATIPLVGINMDNPVISPDGNNLYVQDNSSFILHVINTATNTLVTDIPTRGPGFLVNTSISPGNGCTGAPLTFTITVNPPPPTINVVSAPGAVTTTYGTPSIPGSFSVAGSGLTGLVTVTPPAGFEVSTDNVNYSPTLTLPNSSTLESTMIYSRLAGTTDAGTYAGNIVLSSPGAANVNVAAPNSLVNKRIMNITGTYTKTYGSVVSNVTLFYNTPGVSFSNPAFQNGNSFNSIDLSFSAGTAATDPARTYPGAVTMSNLTGRNGYLSSNYTVNYAPVDLVILPAPLTITINKVTKPYGTAFTTTTGVTSFTPTGLKNGETVGSVSVSYGPGAAAGAAPGTYPGSVVPYAATGGTFTPANYTISYVAAPLDVIVPPPPVITVVSNPQPVNTVYGTPSPSSNFKISAANLASGILVTPPPGFEVSTDNATFSSTVTVGSTGSLASTPVYIRLAATTNAGSYAGNIALTSGATTTNVVMPTSTVSPAPLTIAAVDEAKTYGQALTDLTGSTKFTITAGSLKNGNAITGVAIAYGTGQAATANVATYTGSVTLTGVSGTNGFLASNYAINYTQANIKVLPANLTITANNAAKTYGQILTGGPTNTSFIAAGLQNGETIGSLNLTYTAGGTATDNTGNYPGNIVLSGAVGVTFIPGNYTITYVPGDLTVNPAPLTIAAVDTSRNYGKANPVFKVTYTGFVNGENATVLTKQPTISTTATMESDGGKYPINVTGAAALNYTITYVHGILTITPPVDLVIPNTFTPNYDGINDTWKIPALVSYPDCTVEIFNRYGTIVYNSVGYGIPWDGTVKGRDVPVGVYYYIINTKVAGKKASGSLTVIR